MFGKLCVESSLLSNSSTDRFVCPHIIVGGTGSPKIVVLRLFHTGSSFTSVRFCHWLGPQPEPMTKCLHPMLQLGRGVLALPLLRSWRVNPAVASRLIHPLQTRATSGQPGMFQTPIVDKLWEARQNASDLRAQVPICTVCHIW